MASALITNTTINNHIRKVTPAIMRKRKLLTVLQSRGQVSMKNSGDEFDWRVRYKRHTREGFGSGDAVTFQKVNLHKKAQLPHRAHIITSSIDKFDKLKNDGTPAIVKVWANKVGECIDDLKDSFCEDLFNIDGEASGNEKLIHGVDTIWDNYTAADAGGFIVTPAGTYAGSPCITMTFGQSS